MTKPKFRKGDTVIVNDDCIRERKAFTAGGAGNSFFEKGKLYEVKDVGVYGNGNKNKDHYKVLVEGSTQFTHEDYFVLAKNSQVKTYMVGDKNQHGDIFKIEFQTIDRYPVNGRIENIYSEVMNTRIKINELKDEYNSLNASREKIATIADEYMRISALNNQFTTTELRKLLIAGIETKMVQLELDIEVAERGFNEILKN